MASQTSNTGVSQSALAMVQALSAAGFRGKALTDWTAIGLAESGGDPNVLNNTPATGDYSIGAWQINYFGNLYPERTAKYGPPEQLRGNLTAQAKAAFDLSAGGTNYRPWQSDFNNGSYARNLPVAQEAVAAFNGGASTDLPTNPTATLVASSQDCLLKFPGFNLPVVGTTGDFCILGRQEGKHILGGLLLVAGVGIAALGVVMLVRGRDNPLTALGGFPARKDAGDILAEKHGGNAGMRRESAALKEQKRSVDKSRNYTAKGTQIVDEEGVF